MAIDTKPTTVTAMMVDTWLTSLTTCPPQHTVRKVVSTSLLSVMDSRRHLVHLSLPLDVGERVWEVMYLDLSSTQRSIAIPNAVLHNPGVIERMAARIIELTTKRLGQDSRELLIGSFENEFTNEEMVIFAESILDDYRNFLFPVVALNAIGEFYHVLSTTNAGSAQQSQAAHAALVAVMEESK